MSDISPPFPLKRTVTILIVVLIVAGGGFLRIFRLGELPNGLFCDGAASGYDPYSLLKTGKTLHGDCSSPLF